MNTEKPSSDSSPMKTRREELGLTQRDVAEAGGVTVTTIWNIENGRSKNIRLNPKQFKGICRVLQWMTIDDIPDEWLPSSQN